MMPIVRLGSLGESVKTLQAALNRWPGSHQSRLVIDGFFGLSTNRKVREYQSANQLAPDGVVGAVTWESLRPLVEHVLDTVPPSIDHEASARIVLTSARPVAVAAQSTRSQAAGRAWTATPSARREATRRSARSA